MQRFESNAEWKERKIVFSSFFPSHFRSFSFIYGYVRYTSSQLAVYPAKGKSSRTRERWSLGCYFCRRLDAPQRRRCRPCCIPLQPYNTAYYGRCFLSDNDYHCAPLAGAVCECAVVCGKPFLFPPLKVPAAQQKAWKEKKKIAFFVRIDVIERILLEQLFFFCPCFGQKQITCTLYLLCACIWDVRYWNRAMLVTLWVNYPD